MPVLSISGVRVHGVSACVPQREYDNSNYDWISEHDLKLQLKTIGVEKRRMVEDGVTTSDLCFHAAEKLIQESGWNKDEIQLLVFVAQARDYLLPATGVILQDRLGLSKTCLAFDVSLGCSGYVYGLSIAMSMMQSMGIQKGILLAGDVSTFNSSYRDKSVYTLFGDAGTATLLELKENAPPVSFNMMSDGSGFEAIIIPQGGIRNLANKDSFDEVEISE
ncbi:MAG: ketoacyl-ACP synthase III, partial [Bacteroidota bacterium]